jgi:hypothetical protein
LAPLSRASSGINEGERRALQPAARKIIYVSRIAAASVKRRVFWQPAVGLGVEFFLGNA